MISEMITDFVKKFAAFAEELILNNKAASDGTYAKNTIHSMQTFLKDYQAKLILVDSSLTEKANLIMDEAESAGIEDIKGLKSEINRIRKDYIDSFMRDNKPG